MEQTFMKTKPIFPLVLSMALPMTISMLVNALYNIVDSYFVAQISEDAMTALSLVYPIQNIVTAVTVGFGISINVLVAFYLGAKNQKVANNATTLGLLCNIFHGILLTIICISTIKLYLGLFTDNANVISNGLTYSYIVFAFSIPIAISISFEKIFQAVGQMKVSMICMILGCVTNIILDPILIFGLGIFPKLGIKGAAIATVIGQVATLLGYILFYIFRPIPVKVTVKDLKFNKNLVKKLYSIGFPATLNMALPSLQVSVLNSILSVYSEGYVLVLGAYYKLQTFLYLTANGVVQGMRPLISYNYGAEEYTRVKKIFKTALSIILTVMALGTVLCLLIPEKLIGLFTANPDTISIGLTALRIISIGFIISSVSITVSGSLEALGKGFSSLIISMLRYIFVMLGFAFILNLLIGSTGV
ncbi:MATE family efflux transporter [Eubacterium sp.]|uniref:MATE family efflux transporter n=1 Tax=Eubacterium sp. TaxID=142586 RepID=UPI00399B6439